MFRNTVHPGFEIVHFVVLQIAEDNFEDFHYSVFRIHVVLQVIVSHCSDQLGVTAKQLACIPGVGSTTVLLNELLIAQLGFLFGPEKAYAHRN